MRNAKPHEHVIPLMTSYELLQKHLMTEEIEWERIGDSKCAKERKQNASPLWLQISRHGKER